MKIKKIYLFGGILATAALAFGCQLDESFDVPVEEKVPISMKGDINQLAVTRASDNGFAAGDQVGIWAVNYAGEDTPGTLTLKDNQATNVRFTFDGSSTWTPDYDIYYKDKNTKVDIYGIYPYTSAISSIEAQPFEVQEDQSTISAHGAMGGYEASDFLWAKREAVTPSPSTVQLLFQHLDLVTDIVELLARHGTIFDQFGEALVLAPGIGYLLGDGRHLPLKVKLAAVGGLA